MKHTQVTFRPVTAWPGALTPPGKRRRAQFRAGYSQTLRVLRRELELLDAEHAVIELAVTDREIRLDGMPRGDMRAPQHPGVVVSFDSRHGPLRYATDVFLHWHDNLRGVALGLASLRAVDRYGVTGRGEQYAGWKALTTGDDSMRQRGEALVREHGSVRKALKVVHPDVGGTEEDTAALNAYADHMREVEANARAAVA